MGSVCSKTSNNEFIVQIEEETSSKSVSIIENESRTCIEKSKSTISNNEEITNIFTINTELVQMTSEVGKFQKIRNFLIIKRIKIRRKLQIRDIIN
jgi:hypothetical protein